MRWYEVKGVTISVDLSYSLFYFLIQTSWTNLNSMIFQIKKKIIHWLSVQTFFNLQSHPTFHSEERLANIARGRECIVGLSKILAYGTESQYFRSLSYDYEQVPGSEGGQDWPAQQQRPGPPPHPLGQQVRSAGKKARQIQKPAKFQNKSLAKKSPPNIREDDKMISVQVVATDIIQ